MKSRPEEVTDADWQLVTSLEALAGLLRAAAGRDLREEKLTPGGVAVLEAAQAHSGATSSALANLLGVSRQAASKAVQVLGEQGLVEARQHPSDARAHRVVVTAGGRKALQRSRNRRSPFVSAMLTTLSARERAELGGLLSRLLAAQRPADGEDADAARGGDASSGS